jgi:large subunit ribosomal protein L6
MSRIGKKSVAVPAGVKVSVAADRTVTVAGSKSTLTMKHRPEIKVTVSEADKAVKIEPVESFVNDPNQGAYWGTTRALIANMIEGVTKGYEKSMEVVGVGWTASLAGQKLKLVVGYANPLFMVIPKGLTVTVDKQIVKIVGPDKQQVGQFASAMRALRKPEPYNGKGIKYTTETIKKKQGKAFGA